MIISVVNHTNQELSDQEIQTTIRAINRQIHEDYAPYWGMSATLRLEGESGQAPDLLKAAEMRGDAVIYIWNEANIPGALGYHERNLRGIPYAFVFLRIAQALGEDWRVTLSHEALELIADPYANLLVMGPHPRDDVTVFHWYEMCDAVQGETYEIDGVKVSNFVLPLYFTSDEETEGRNDFLGTVINGQSLKSFGVNPGGYLGFFDPRTGKHEQYTLARDLAAQQRLEVKLQLQDARRSVQYQRFHAKDKVVAANGKPAVKPRKTRAGSTSRRRPRASTKAAKP